MPGCQFGPSVKGSPGAGGIGVIVGRGMILCGRFTGPMFKALVGVAPARVQDGEPGERCKVHGVESLDWIAHHSQDRELKYPQDLC
jgi:hypothetical protein